MPDLILMKTKSLYFLVLLTSENTKVTAEIFIPLYSQTSTNFIGMRQKIKGTVELFNKISINKHLASPCSIHHPKIEHEQLQTNCDMAIHLI